MLLHCWRKWHYFSTMVIQIKVCIIIVRCVSCGTGRFLKVKAISLKAYIDLPVFLLSNGVNIIPAAFCNKKEG